ncbi:MAG: UTP--glucose-1-phosphate uridylyltransferase, partial [Candidatus Omnitrophica bacterium]|nr:UTP--glucose-1-phosphate uridylyltransferase [Candidatus Omnitrophota bacterium]
NQSTSSQAASSHPAFSSLSSRAQTRDPGSKNGLLDSRLRGNDKLSSIIKEIILPAIEKEVNTGKNFAPLRQIYHSLILAKWYKEKVRNSILSSSYINKNKVAGIDENNPKAKEEIYTQYMEAYKKGVYNYMKEEYDPKTQQIMPKKYFSGGFKDADLAMKTASAKEIARSIVGQDFNMSVNIAGKKDKAMMSSAPSRDGDYDGEVVDGYIWKQNYSIGSVIPAGTPIEGGSWEMLPEDYSDSALVTDNKKPVDHAMLTDAEMKEQFAQAKKLYPDLKDTDLDYLGQMWKQAFARRYGNTDNKSNQPIKIILDYKKHVNDHPADQNFILATDLDETQRKNWLGEESYEDLVKDPQNAEAAKKAYMTLNSMDGGIGESLDRIEFLKEMILAQAKEDAKGEKITVEEYIDPATDKKTGYVIRYADKEITVVRGAKGTDLGYEISVASLGIKNPSKKGKVFVSIAEAKFLQLIEILKEKIFAGVELQPLVNWQSKKSYEKLFNQEYLLDRLDADRIVKRTYRQMFEAAGVEILPYREQADLPWVNKDLKSLALKSDTPMFRYRQPGGHGYWGYLFLWDAYTAQIPEGQTHIRVFYNGDNINSRVSDVIAGAMVRRNLPIIKLTTVATPIDNKGGKDGVRMVDVVIDGKIVQVPVPAQMEVADAKAVDQEKDFIQGGQKEGNQPFNTNIFYINTSLLHKIFVKLVRDFGEEKLKEVISSVYIEKKLQKGFDTDKEEYVPIDGAIGTNMHNLNQFFLTEPKAKAILEEVSDELGLKGKDRLDRLLYFVSIPRTEFFTPVKKNYDILLQQSDYYTFDAKQWVLRDSKPNAVPPEITLDDKEGFWSEQQNYINAFGKRIGMKDLKSLTILGKVKILNPIFRGKVKIESAFDKGLFDLTGYNEMAHLFPTENGRPVLENISLKIYSNGLVVKVADVNNKDFRTAFLDGILKGNNTYAMLKPDAVKAYQEAIMSYLSEKKLNGEDIKVSMGPQITLTREQAAEFYSSKKGKDFYETLLDYVTSGPVIPLFIETKSPKAVEEIRAIVEQIREHFKGEDSNLTVNRIHGSDSPANAAEETSNIFKYYDAAKTDKAMMASEQAEAYFAKSSVRSVLWDIVHKYIYIPYDSTSADSYFERYEEEHPLVDGTNASLQDESAHIDSAWAGYRLAAEDAKFEEMIETGKTLFEGKEVRLLSTDKKDLTEYYIDLGIAEWYKLPYTLEKESNAATGNNTAKRVDATKENKTAPETKAMSVEDEIRTKLREKGVSSNFDSLFREALEIYRSGYDFEVRYSAPTTSREWVEATTGHLEHDLGTDQPTWVEDPVEYKYVPDSGHIGYDIGQDAQVWVDDPAHYERVQGMPGHFEKVEVPGSWYVVKGEKLPDNAPKLDKAMMAISPITNWYINHKLTDAAHPKVQLSAIKLLSFFYKNNPRLQEKIKQGFFDHLIGKDGSTVQSRQAVRDALAALNVPSSEMRMANSRVIQYSNDAEAMKEAFDQLRNLQAWDNFESQGAPADQAMMTFPGSSAWFMKRLNSINVDVQTQAVNVLARRYLKAKSFVKQDQIKEALFSHLRRLESTPQSRKAVRAKLAALNISKKERIKAEVDVIKSSSNARLIEEAVEALKAVDDSIAKMYQQVSEKLSKSAGLFANTSTETSELLPFALSLRIEGYDFDLVSVEDIAKGLADIVKMDGLEDSIFPTGKVTVTGYTIAQGNKISESLIGTDKAMISEDEARSLIESKLDSQYHYLISSENISDVQRIRDSGHYPSHDFEVIYHPGTPEMEEVLAWVGGTQVPYGSQPTGKRISEYLEIINSQTSVDHALVTKKPDEVGGIDMNNINLKGDGKGKFTFQFDPKVMEQFKDVPVDNLSPVIINIVPLPSIFPLLGLAEPGKENLEKKVELSPMDKVG